MARCPCSTPRLSFKYPSRTLSPAHSAPLGGSLSSEEFAATQRASRTQAVARHFAAVHFVAAAAALPSLAVSPKSSPSSRRVRQPRTSAATALPPRCLAAARSCRSSAALNHERGTEIHGRACKWSPASVGRKSNSSLSHRIPVTKATPNQSLEGTSTGKALGPRTGQYHHPSRGPSALPAAAAQLKR